MKIPIKIAFRDFSPTDAVVLQIRERADKLEQFFHQITSCRITVGKAHRKHHKGNLYYARIDITVPGEEIVVGNCHDFDGAHGDVYVALRDSFAIAQRQLQDYVRRRRVRTHLKERAGPLHGRVTQLLWDDRGAFGFIRSMDNRDFYFHSNSLVNADFDRLQVGVEVRFSEELGEEGPQASTVELAHPKLHRPAPAA
ncbi:MAG: hypothetical protein A2X94_01910 [Bdellovibrionales bacterium GWB1_55_8]|nr:MAG: hypothetical protein A2X94_01910 [Bdellovibrionales bacterium GWB1_55_8]